MSKKNFPLPRNVFLSSVCSVHHYFLLMNAHIVNKWFSSQLPTVHCVSVLKMDFPLDLSTDIIVSQLTAIEIKCKEREYTRTVVFSAENPREREEQSISIPCQHFTACGIYILFTHIKYVIDISRHRVFHRHCNHNNL